MRILLVSPKSSVWSSRKHIHMGLGYLAGALIAALSVELVAPTVMALADRVAERLRTRLPELAVEPG
mgnify:CR=1 FL=1